MYRDHLFPLNEIGFKTAQALYDKYTEPLTPSKRNNSLYTEEHPKVFGIRNPTKEDDITYFYDMSPKLDDKTMRANRIIGRLHDRMRFGKLGGDKISDQDREKFNKMNYYAQNQVRDETLRRIASHPGGLIQGAKEINKEIITPRLSRHLENVPKEYRGMMLAKGADSPYHLHHIGINKEQYPNDVLAKAEALERATHFDNTIDYIHKSKGDPQKNNMKRLFWMNRNAEQILGNQMYSDDYNRPGKIHRDFTHDYQYIPNAPKWKNWAMEGKPVSNHVFPMYPSKKNYTKNPVKIY